jgi:DNA-binding response OmpR family regulator
MWRQAAAERLGAEGYVTTVELARCTERILDHRFDVAIVDVSGGDGALDLVAALRQRSRLPILAVSPERFPEAAVLEVLAAGADQLVTRDVLHALAARTRALLRRTPPGTAWPDDDEVVPRSADSIALDQAAGVVVVAGTRVALTDREAEILGALIRRPGCVVTRDQLAGATRSARADRGLDSLVRGIRTKLEAAEGHRRIVTVRGLGFRLRTDAELDPTAVESESAAG